MQKKIGIFLSLLILTGCSVQRINFSNSKIRSEVDSFKIGEQDILKENLTLQSFFIQKADIEIENGGDKQSFIASVKYKKPDSFLISIKSNSGIEAARVFLTKDTIIINERINKKIYYGSKYSMTNKYGFTGNVLPVFFGDVIANINDQKTYICKNGVTKVESVLNGKKLEFNLNCFTRKPDNLSVTDETESKILKFDYLDYVTVNNIIYLKKLRINNFSDFDLINIRYGKIVIPWSGNIEFIPGKGYQLVEIK